MPISRAKRRTEGAAATSLDGVGAEDAGCVTGAGIVFSSTTGADLKADFSSMLGFAGSSCFFVSAWAAASIIIIIWPTFISVLALIKISLTTPLRKEGTSKTAL